MRRARPSGMRVIGLVLAVVLGAVGMVVTASSPAAACSCVMSTTAQHVEAADVIVTGTLESIGRPLEEEVVSSLDPVTYTVAVESVYKGEAGRELRFTSALMGASCGVEGLEVDRRYTLFLNRLGPRVSRFVQGEPGDLTSGLCSGNRGARDSVDRRITALTGPPVAVADGPPAPVSPMPVVRDDSRAAWALPATGAVLTGLAAAAVLVWRRRTRP